MLCKLNHESSKKRFTLYLLPLRKLKNPGSVEQKSYHYDDDTYILLRLSCTHGGEQPLSKRLYLVWVYMHLFVKEKNSLKETYSSSHRVTSNLCINHMPKHTLNAVCWYTQAHCCSPDSLAEKAGHKNKSLRQWEPGASTHDYSFVVSNKSSKMSVGTVKNPKW